MNPWKLFLLCLLAAAPATRGEDWPFWRGPQRNGISTETGWQDQWPAAGPPILWKASVGLGFSSFAAANGRVYTTGNKNNQDTVFCFDAATGKVVWKHSYDAELGDKYFEGGTGSTPTVDGDRVFALSRWGDLFCFEAASGKIVWERNLAKEMNARIPDWGFCGSPLAHGDLLILNVGDAGLALDKRTGKEVWKSPNEDPGYSTPYPVQRDGRWLAVVSSGDAYSAVDIRTGKEVWRMPWLTQYGVNAADPVIEGEHVFISSGYGKGSALLKWGAGEPSTVWKSKALRNQFHSSVLIDGHLYGIDGDTSQKAMLKCLEFATGKEKWSYPGIGSGALMAADGKLIVLSERGELLVAPASPDGFSPKARAQVLGGKSWTVPVLANGRIYCRNSRGDIACVDVRKSAAP